jgi:hypothetical protein
VILDGELIAPTVSYQCSNEVFMVISVQGNPGEFNFLVEVCSTHFAEATQMLEPPDPESEHDSTP